jgi:methionyl-tRNA synthetase
MKVWSNNARAVTKGWLDGGLQDRCITRDIKWGVPVPERYLDEGKVFYVWFEAPIGYMSMSATLLGDKWRKWWLPEPGVKVELNQFMGKDNILFHSIIHPATLQCTGEPYIKPYRLAVT